MGVTTGRGRRRLLLDRLLFLGDLEPFWLKPLQKGRERNHKSLDKDVQLVQCDDHSLLILRLITFCPKSKTRPSGPISSTKKLSGTTESGGEAENRRRRQKIGHFFSQHWVSQFLNAKVIRGIGGPLAKTSLWFLRLGHLYQFLFANILSLLTLFGFHLCAGKVCPRGEQATKNGTRGKC